MTRVLALDPSCSTGVAVGIINPQNIMSIQEVGLFLADKEKSQGQMYVEYLERLRLLVQNLNPDIIIHETFFSSGKFAQGVDVNFVLRGLIKIVIFENSKITFEASPSEWKKFIAKRSTPTKDEKQVYGTKANKMFIQKAIIESGINVAEHYIGVSKRKVKVPSDVWDAIGILRYGCYLASYCHEVEPINIENIIIY